MKLNKLIYGLLAVAFIAAAGTGCRKSQFNINKNQNNPTDSTIAYNTILPAALNSTGSLIARQWGPIQNWMSFWARSGTYAPNVTEETYQITTTFGNGVWNNAYDNAFDYAVIINKAAQANAGFYEGIARIMKTIDFQVLVDVYGNVPYTDALKASANPTPKYDKGIDIYKDMFSEIDKGLALINAATVNSTNPNRFIATDDIMFQGNKTMWNKFGNTLKLRLLIHAYAVAGIDKVAVMNSITANGNGFLGAGENAQVNPGYSGNDKPNPFFNQYITNTDGSANANNVYYKANEWGIEYYKFDGDPRTARFYANGTGGSKGVAYGLPPVTANAATVLAGIGPGLNKGATAPQAILTAAESFFLQAEARERGIITSGSTASSLLTAAINESFTFVGATGAASYIANNATFPDVDYAGVAQGTGGPAGGLFTILSQKWFALNGINTLEVWTDWRRVPYTEVATKLLINGANAPSTNFVYGDGGGFFGGASSPGPGPFRSVSPQIRTEDNIPVRYLYPQTEYNYNTANVAAEGTITRYSRVFWDLQ